MEITRNVPDLDPDEKRLFESLLGRELRANQQVCLHVVTREDGRDSPEVVVKSPGVLPDYCNVYDGLSDDEIDELEAIILDRSPSRSACSDDA